MATYYVNKGGNDETGTGTELLPWLTVSKGLSMLSAGDTLRIAAGTYAENTASTGYFRVITNFASETFIEGESANNPGAVVITGASDATYNTVIQGNSNNTTFRYLTFGMRLGSNAQAVRLSACTGVKFVNCGFVVTSNASLRYGVNISPTTGATVSNITFSGCSFTQTGAFAANGIWSNWATGQTISNIAITNCTGNMAGDCLYLRGGSYVVTGGGFTSTAVHTVCFGEDTNTSAMTTTGSISGAAMVCGSGHALILGAGCSNVTITGCSIQGGDQGLCIKQNTGTSASGCTIVGGGNAAVYFKAATSASVTSCFITGAGTQLIRLGAGDAADKCQNCTLTDNLVQPTGAANIFAWGDDTADLGGGVVDRNNYSRRGTGNYGAVRSTSGITTLAGLRAAWALYSATNDLASREPSRRKLLRRAGKAWFLEG